MAAFDSLKGWSTTAKHTVTASYLAWTMDAYDFFLLTLVFKDIAAQFGTSITKVAVATMLTLACRPLGAFIFGRLADRYGRRPVLMLDIALYSLLRRANLRVLRRLKPADLEKGGFHPEHKRKVTVAEIVEMMAKHGPSHLEQIERLKQMAGGGTPAAARSQKPRVH